MSENFDELNARLKKADPAVAAPELGADMLSRATNAKPAKSARFRLGALATAASGLAATLAIAIAVATPAQPLFELSSTSGQNLGAGVESDSKMAGSMLMPYVQYEFVAGSELSNQELSGEVYQIKASPYIKEWVENLAVQLGVTGESVKLDYGTETDFMIGGDPTGLKGIGNAGPYISYSTANGYYYYSNEAAYGTWRCDDNKDNCVQKDVPASLRKPMPNKQQAIEVAGEYGLADFGGEGRWEFFSDAGYASLVGYSQINGIDAIATSLYWAPSGILASIQGSYVDIVSKGTLSTISAAKAVERLNDYRWGAGLPASYYSEPSFYQMMPMMRGLDDVAVSSDSAAGSSASGTDGAAVEATAEPAPVEPTAEATVEPAPVDPTVEPLPVDPTVEPAPIEPMPTPTIEKVEIVKAKLTMVTVWDAKGNMWLVPGYALYAEKGLVGGVIALHDGVLKLPEVMPGVLSW
jgi:hypothetical protein